MLGATQAEVAIKRIHNFYNVYVWGYII